MERVDFNAFYEGNDMSFGSDITAGLELVFNLLPRTSKVLELGCGDGRDTFHLAKEFAEVDCVDASTVAISKLESFSRKEGFENVINAVLKQVQDIDPSEKDYDLFVAVTLFDHFPRPQSLEELHRFIESARSGAYFFLMVHTVDDPGNEPGARSSELSAAIQTYFDRNELLEVAREAGHVTYYKELRELDSDHGEPHYHSYATVIFRKK